jgi:single-stranded-DNA-specific exonuclease
MSLDPEWVRPAPDAATVRRLADALDCSSALAAVLAARGVTDPEAAARWLAPSTEAIHDPGDLPEIDSAVDRLTRAVTRGESVLVYADRDVDGGTGCAVLQPLLDDLGADVQRHVPGKYDGYGLDAEVLTARATDLVVAVDCGTTAHDAIDAAVDADTDVVVVDHHDPDASLPAATACVNPRRQDSTYPNTDLAAGAVAWKVGQALLTSHDPVRIEGYHRRTLPLAAVATVGDYVSLTLENRAIVREGYERLPDSGLPGLERTATRCGVDSLQDLGWSLVPLLNAAQEADSGEKMVEVLLARGSDRIDALLDQLETYRADRRRDRQERIDHLRACFDAGIDPGDPAYVVRTDDYVGGSAMHTLSEEWYRPVFTYRRRGDAYKGGARSAPDVDLLEVLDACTDLLEDYWGHPGAAGFRMDLDAPAPFERRVHEVVTERYDIDRFRPTLDIDATVAPTDLHDGIVDDLEALAPFGTDHDEPLLVVEAVVFEEFEQFGDGDAHWKGHPETGAFTVLDWGGDTLPDVLVDGTYDVAGTVSEDDWRGGVVLEVEGVRQRE